MTGNCFVRSSVVCPPFKCCYGTKVQKYKGTDKTLVWSFAVVGFGGAKPFQQLNCVAPGTENIPNVNKRGAMNQLADRAANNIQIIAQIHYYHLRASINCPASLQTHLSNLGCLFLLSQTVRYFHSFFDQAIGFTLLVCDINPSDLRNESISRRRRDPL